MEPRSPEALSVMSRQNLAVGCAEYGRLEYPRDGTSWMGDRPEYKVHKEPQWDDHPSTWMARMSERLRRGRIRRERARIAAAAQTLPATGGTSVTDAAVPKGLGPASR